MTVPPSAPGPDREVFLARFLEILPSLRSYLEAVVGVASDADDLVQEVSLALWREYDRYDPTRPLLGWALGIARNHAARWRRDRVVARRRFSPEAEAALAIAYQELEDELAGRRVALRDCVQRLSTHARDLLALRYERGLELAEIARLRDSSLNAINKALGKVRRLLALCAERAEATTR